VFPRASNYTSQGLFQDEKILCCPGKLEQTELHSKYTVCFKYTSTVYFTQSLAFSVC